MSHLWGIDLGGTKIEGAVLDPAALDRPVCRLRISTESEKAETVIRHIAEELKRMKDEGLVEGELERAKRWVKGTLVRKLENTESRMYWLGEHYMMTGEVMPLGKILEEFDKVTAEDVVRVSNELFKRNKLCVVLHAPETQGKQIAKNIKTLDF